MQIKVLYFASLRDNAKVDQETIQTQSETIDQLFDELSQKYDFSLNKDDLKVAKNEEYVPFNTTLTENDTIVFIPPVAGG